MIEFLLPLYMLDVPLPLTPRQLTLPIFELSCDLVGYQGSKRELELRQTGGRGFFDGRDRTRGYFQRTNVMIDVLEDSANELNAVRHQGMRGVSDWSWPEGIILSNDTSDDELSAQGRVELVFNPTPQEDQFSLMLKPFGPFQEKVSYVGFCDVRETAQEPLSASETEEWLSQ